MQRFQTEARKDKELKEVQTLTNENTGGLLFNLPAGIEIDGQMNVLMVAVEPLVDAWWLSLFLLILRSLKCLNKLLADSR